MANVFDLGLDGEYERRICERVDALLRELAETHSFTQTSFEIHIPCFLQIYTFVLSFRRVKGIYIFSGRMAIPHPRSLRNAEGVEMLDFCHLLAKALGGFESGQVVTTGNNFTEWTQAVCSPDPTQEVTYLVSFLYEGAEKCAERADCFLQGYGNIMFPNISTGQAVDMVV